MRNVTESNSRKQKLASFWKSLDKAEKVSLSEKCSSTPDYLRKIFCNPWRKPGTNLAKSLAEQTGLEKEVFRPDVWG